MTPHRVGRLAVQIFPASVSPATGDRVLVVHGLGEHSGRHRTTIEFLNRQGTEVVAFDLRGSGASEGRRQFVARFDEYLDDVAQVRQWLAESLPPLRLYLFGHSLGGTIAIRYAAMHPEGLAGLILSAPGYQVGEGISPLKIAVAKALGRIFPRLRIPGTLEVGAISRDPAEVTAYCADPLNCRFNTARQGIEILRVLETLPADCRRIRLPTLIVHGSADRICRVEGSRKLWSEIAAADKHLEIFPGGYHELHNDLDRELFFAKIAAWMAERRGSAVS
jgi:alpha-beta hydrolase superfamily lysophospholipase